MKRILFCVLPFALPLLAEGDPLAEAKSAIAAKDSDADGRLSSTELGAGDAIFRLLDRNRDGFLDAPELVPPPRPDPRDGPGGWGMGPGGPGGSGEDRDGPDGIPTGPPSGEETRRMADGLLHKLDRDGDGKLSREEMPEGGRPDLSRADKNNDGFVDHFEITLALSEGPGRGRDMLAKLKEMDKNGDGSIARDEWKGPEEMFARMDRDQDGTVTREEVAEIAKRMGGWRGKSGDALLRRADKDQDGKISREEWPLPAEQFDRFDANADGFVAPDEMMPQGPRQGRDEERPGKEGGDFLGKHDTDKDGKVTREEFPNERRFAEMDANGDGILDATEVDEAMDRRNSEKGYGFMESYDQNRDGKVTKEEFTGPARLFEREDRNKDGTVDAADNPPK